VCLLTSGWFPGPKLLDRSSVWCFRISAERLQRPWKAGKRWTTLRSIFFNLGEVFNHTRLASNCQDSCILCHQHTVNSWSQLSSIISSFFPCHCVDIFDKSSMTQLLVRSIIPKLVAALRNQSVEPDGQSTVYLSAVMVWRDLVPREHMLCLIEGEFFPKWFTVSYHVGIHVAI
jgi:hypothetical protein